MNYRVPVPHRNSRSATKKKTSLIILISAIGAVFIIFVILIISLNNAYQNSAKLAEGIEINPEAAKTYPLSDDQTAIVNQYGSPDSFTITFYIEEFDPYYDGEVRDETWRYYAEGLVFDFYNGSLMYTNPIADPSVDWVQLPYKPEQFTAYANLETILASAAITDIFELPLEKELVKNGKLYYAPGLSFGMVDGQLIFVETVMMQEEGG